MRRVIMLAIASLLLTLVGCSHQSAPAGLVVGINGTVIDGHGSAVQGAVVVFYRAEVNITESMLTTQGALAKQALAYQTVTDAQGAFHYEDAPPGTYNIYVTSGDLAGFIANVAVESGVTVQATDVTIKHTGAIAGTVTLSDGANPEGVAVFIPGTGFMAFCDAQGAFDIQGVPESPTDQTYRVVAMFSGYINAAGNVGVVKDETSTINLELHPPAATPPTITGVTPDPVEQGGELTITGTYFGAVRGSSDVTIGGFAVEEYLSWSSDAIEVRVPVAVPVGLTTVVVGVVDTEASAAITVAHPFTITEFQASSEDLGDSTTFTWAISNPGVSLTCALDPGDGSGSVTVTDCANTTSQTHTYAAAGSYTATLTIQGTSTSQTTSVTVYSAGEGKLTNVIMVAAGGSHSMALKTDGTVWAWGKNVDGALGDGTEVTRSSPVQVSGLNNVSAIAAGGYYYYGQEVPDFSLALKNDGTVWAWGNNDAGQLGDGTTTTSASPVQVTGLTNVTAVAAGPGSYFSLALKNDGTVWAWGNNDAGQLGDGTTTTSASPVQVTGLTNVTAIAGGYAHSLALRQDGTVWAWGYNFYGQLGDGTTTDSTTPVQVTGLTNVTAIAAGHHFSMALKTNDTTWDWGDDYYGQLGNGVSGFPTAVGAFPTPVQIVGLTNVTGIAASGEYSLAVKADGTVWASGDNTYGQLGDGTTTSSATPVEVVAP